MFLAEPFIDNKRSGGDTLGRKEVIKVAVAVKAQDQIRSVPRSIFPEFRAWVDWFQLRFSSVYKGRGVPKGDGSAVILVPGFLGFDWYLGIMWMWLRRIGYRPYMSGIGQNADCLEILYPRLAKTIERAYRETGRPVHLIGYSLGGFLILSAAADKPDKIAQVITLGSPFRAITVNPWVALTASAVRFLIFHRHIWKGLPRDCYTPACECSTIKRLRGRRIPSSVDRVAVFTLEDRVAYWKDCIYPNDRLNREVHGGTHISLAFHSESFRIIGEELARCEVEERAVA